SVTDYAGAVAAIKAGGTYFNLHTAANPGGEIRGQIGAAAPAPTPAATTPAATTPPTSTVDGFGAASGTAPILIALGLLALAMSTALVIREHRPGSR
ncbi:MAG: CHRD domain-containing protein, partial [Chloroflexota bacterium]